MMFSVIYSVDCPMNVSIKQYLPKGRAWFQTERSDGESSDWCSDLWGGKCKHRKICGFVTKKQFLEFIDRTGLFAEDVETMGSLGAPGLGFGVSPAISFRTDDPDCIQSAYVTPIPFIKTNKANESDRLRRELTERDWDRVRRAVINQFGI